jgi:hypothetical protein
VPFSSASLRRNVAGDAEPSRRPPPAYLELKWRYRLNACGSGLNSGGLPFMMRVKVSMAKARRRDAPGGKMFPDHSSGKPGNRLEGGVQEAITRQFDRENNVPDIFDKAAVAFLIS